MTFKEWYNQLSKESQQWIARKDPWWFDKNSPTLYSHVGSDKLRPYKIQPATLTNIFNAYGEYSASEKMALRTLAVIDKISKEHPEAIDSKEIQDIVDTHGLDINSYCYCFIKDIPKRKQLYKKAKLEKNQNNYKPFKLGLLDTIFVQEDYSKFDFSCMESFNNMLNFNFGLDSADMNVLLEILPKSIIKEAVKELPGKYKLNHSVLNDDVFDELFFGANGWTAAQRREVIKNNYSGYMDDILDFLKRIVSVDHTYLRYVRTLIESNTAVAKELYSLRKPADELTGNESIQKQFRLSTEIRKLIQVAACCSRKRVGKAMRSNLGAVGPLVQMYKFDFNVIYDALYPDDGQINWENK